MELDPSGVSVQWHNGDKNSFAYSFTRENLPATIVHIVDDINLTLSETPEGDIKTEGKLIAEKIAKIKYEIENNHQLAPIGDHDANVSAYNVELQQRGAPKWLETTWLFSGCYLYRRIQSYFSMSTNWKTYDVFARTKISSLKSSRTAILELADQYRTVVSNLDHKSQGGEIQEQAEELLFIEMAEICLWGNKTDLSLHTNLTEEDIQKLQDAKVRKASEKILVNDLSKAFAVLHKAREEGKSNRRVDFVLDNAGFELFVDLILAGYLLSSNLATTVVLRPKNFPWFVSDVVSKDFTDLLDGLQNAATFFKSTSNGSEAAMSKEELGNLAFLSENWGSLHRQGKLLIQTHDFWTDGGSFWRLPGIAPDLHLDLKESELVVFKGDLNYRKLIADVEWPPTKPFSEAIGPLGPHSGLRVLALRTCKADVICGLPEGKDEELRNSQSGGSGPKRLWAWHGEWAVIQFSDGK